MAGRVQRGIEHPQIGKHGESSGSSAAAPQPLEIMLGLENENYFLPHNMVKHPEMPATQLHEHYQHAERHTLEGFADALVHNYMRHVFYREFRLAASIRMFSLVCDDEDEEKEAPQQRYLEWCVEEDASLPNNTTPPFGVEIISPVLNAAWWKPALGEMWRDYLEQHYHITGSPPNSNPENEERCTTHVHTSMREPFTVDQIKRIVCGYIMLEPALEAVLPDAIQVRGASYIKSIYFDNPNFARRGLTREQAVGEVKRRSTILQIIDLIQPDFNSNLNRKHWGLNFLNLLKLPGAQTIEYRRGNFSEFPPAWCKCCPSWALLTKC